MIKRTYTITGLKPVGNPFLDALMRACDPTYAGAFIPFAEQAEVSGRDDAPVEAWAEAIRTAYEQVGYRNVRIVPV